jgi:hypothetical protein
VHILSLLATIVVVGLVDGGLLLLCIGIAETPGRGVMYFFVGGGPPTILYAGYLYSWFKKHLVRVHEVPRSTPFRGS